MGDHYVPQYYLRGFGAPPTRDTIARFERGNVRVLVTKIKNVAHETGYYGPEMETFLAEQIEAPANIVLDKIRKKESITVSEKHVLATYIAVMVQRVPSGKERAEQMAPEAIKATFEKVEHAFASALERDPNKAEAVAQQRVTLARLRKQYDERFPKSFWLDALRFFATGRTKDVIGQMTWRIMFDERESAFLTSDNPVFFTTDIGLGNRHAELTFPISVHHTLWATWRDDLGEGYFPANPRVVAEINRRTVNSATRYVFFPREEKWVSHLVQRKDHVLHRLV